jgi:hypothetical protein
VDDGTLVAIWQDDLSGLPHLVGRRFTTRSASAGLPVHFGYGLRTRNADFSSPAAVALDGTRFLLVAEHVVPGKGREIGLTLIGAGWDEVEGR